jgi:hypothetical protein
VKTKNTRASRSIRARLDGSSAGVEDQILAWPERLADALGMGARAFVFRAQSLPGKSPGSTKDNQETWAPVCEKRNSVL